MPLGRLGSNHCGAPASWRCYAVFSARMNSRSGTKRISLAAVFAALVLSAARADALPSFGMFTSYQSARQNLPNPLDKICFARAGYHGGCRTPVAAHLRTIDAMVGPKC